MMGMDWFLLTIAGLRVFSPSLCPMAVVAILSYGSGVVVAFGWCWEDVVGVVDSLMSFFLLPGLLLYRA